MDLKRSNQLDMERRNFLSAASCLPLSLLSLSGIVTPLFAQSTDRYGIRGRVAPDLQVDYWIDKKGKATQFDPTAVKGKWVYMKMFQNWCPGCHEYGFPALKKVADEFAEHDQVEVLAIQTVFEGFGVNSRDSVRELQLKYQLPIMMGHDAGNPTGDHHPRTMRDFRTGGTPWVVIVAPDGRVIFNDFHINADKFITYLNQQLV